MDDRPLSTEDTTGYSNDAMKHKPAPGSGSVTETGHASEPEREREREPERHAVTGRPPKR